MTATWPEGMVALSDLVGPLREAQRRVRKGEPADYNGLGIPSFLHVAVDIDKTLMPEALERRNEDADTALLTCAVQLGMEQGVRYHEAEQVHLWHLLRAVNDCIQAGDPAGLKLARETMARVMSWAP